MKQMNAMNVMSANTVFIVMLFYSSF
jgi:hypothetical protein